MKTGADLRDEALDLFAQHKTDWVDRLRTAMVELARERATRNLPVSGDDATQWLDSHGYHGDYRLIGAVFRSGWKQVGYAPSLLARRHHRPIALWALDRNG